MKNHGENGNDIQFLDTSNVDEPSAAVDDIFGDADIGKIKLNLFILFL